VLNHTRGDLGLPANKMILVSEDESFAAAARKEGYSVRYVSSSPAPEALRPWQFHSVTKFKDWLARQPITK
jgi:hypothetical protein